MQSYEELLEENETLRKQIEEMSEQVLLLHYLEMLGVDNWDGYGDAQSLMSDEADEEDLY